ncbi:MAG: hypothetical protein EOO28_13220 [Comamonadaceae bacterium]|nr:MAG: hypothetical protein EOO28_13220 [Comamonadaceae bacterium]
MTDPAISRRQFSLWAAAFASSAITAHAQIPATQRPFLGDMHSHYGMFTPRPPGTIQLGDQMRATGTTLLAWTIVDDSPWITETPRGIKQKAQPGAGDLWAHFTRRVAGYDNALKIWKLPKALTPVDVDAALSGEQRVVMASESANFLEARPERVAEAHAMGLRHLQLVHYIDSPLGDRQTEAPALGKVPEVTLQVVAECKRLGILVDLAHSTPESVDTILGASDATVIWSHSYISRFGGSWKDRAYQARSLSPVQAGKIAARGGVVGLWTVRVRGDSAYPVYSVSSYADEIARMVDLIGPDAVAFGTDMEGTGRDPVMTNYNELREVAENLARRGWPDTTLQKVCIGNYARVLRKAMTST